MALGKFYSDPSEGGYSLFSHDIWANSEGWEMIDDLQYVLVWTIIVRRQVQKSGASAYIT